MPPYDPLRRRREDWLRWQVARDRFQLADREPPAGEPDLALAPAIGEALRTIDRRCQPDVMELVRKAWPELIGPAAARHARPGVLDRGALVVFAENTVWLSELSRGDRGGLLKRLQRRFGADRFRAVRWKPDPEGGRRA